MGSNTTEDNASVARIMPLNTIQRVRKLNDVFPDDVRAADGANHRYAIVNIGSETKIAEVQFQKGPRNEPGSTEGVLDADLLEIVRDRLRGFQTGEYATRENAIALTHIEEALLWMNKRVEDRVARGVLGTTIK